MVLPAGFGLPPLPYLLVLIASVLVAGGLLYRERPAVTPPVVLALATWMIAGAAFHAIYQLEISPPVIEPLLGTPAVYLSTFSLVCASWYVTTVILPDRVPQVIATSGSIVFVIGAAWVVLSADSIRLFLPLGTVAIAVILALLCWVGLTVTDRAAIQATGRVGLLVVFAHALDGVSTAVGADVLGFVERTPLSAAIMEFAGTLPTADLLGVGWLFVLVKLALVIVVLELFVEYVREAPEQAYILLAVIAAVGLGPGTQNVLLYLVA